MSGFTIWHWLVTLAVLPVALLFTPAGAAVFAAWRLTRRSRERR